MNRIVRTLRVEELPEVLREDALRSGFAPGSTVEISITDTVEPRPVKTTAELLAMLDEVSRTGRKDETIENAVARVRELRDEWDD